MFSQKNAEEYSPLFLALRSRSTGKVSALEMVVGGWQIMPEDEEEDCSAGATVDTVVVVDEITPTAETPLLLLVTVVAIAVETVSVATVAVAAADVDDGEACW